VLATAALSPSVTDHALLVPLGRFAAQIGVRDALERVPYPMKTIAHRPGEKLAELEAHILAGGMHIHELAASSHPLVQAHIAAQSRTLIVGRPGALVLHFAADSRWAGIRLLLRPTVAYQLWFAFLEDSVPLRRAP